MSIAENLQRVQEQLSNAANAAGRETGEIRLMAVSKNHPRESVDEAYAAGQRLFGENRVQEGSAKFEEKAPDMEVHLIGHLQSNKAKPAGLSFDCIQSIDKLKTAGAVSRNLGADRVLPVLVEVNTSDEDSKNGVRSEEGLWALIDGVAELPNLQLRGFMTLAAFVDDEKIVRACFSRLFALREKALSRYPELSLPELSMGMSDDFPWAVKEGSTLIRVGTAIFGGRAVTL